MVWRLIILAIQAVIFSLLSGFVLGGAFMLVLAVTGQIDIQNITQQMSSGNYPMLDVVATLSTLFGALLLVIVGALFPDRRTFRDYGLRLGQKDWWLDLGFGLGLGVFLMALIFAVELLAGWVTVEDYMVFPANMPGFAAGILAAVVTFLSVGIYEEVLFRGVLFKGVAEGLGNIKFVGRAGAIIATLVITSALFGWAHAGNPNATAVSTFNIFLAGIFLGMGYILTGELAIPIGIHITWNFFQGNVFGFPVSGTAANQTTFISISQGGSDLWTGGGFGPEAGLIGIGALIIGTVLIIGYVRLRYGEVKLAQKISIPELRWQKQSKQSNEASDTPAEVEPVA